MTGKGYITLNEQTLENASSVVSCGTIVGGVSGRTLSFTMTVTPENCGIFLGSETISFTITGQAEGNIFTGSYSLITGRTEAFGAADSIMLENVPSTDPRVDFNIN